jgi:hypothetical protein
MRDFTKTYNSHDKRTAEWETPVGLLIKPPQHGDNARRARPAGAGASGGAQRVGIGTC